MVRPCQKTKQTNQKRMCSSMEEIIGKKLIEIFASHVTNRKFVITKDITIVFKNCDLRLTTNCIFSTF